MQLIVHVAGVDATVGDISIAGAWRFTQRLWRQASAVLESLPPAGTAKPAQFSEKALGLRRSLHKAIKAISEDIERFHFNKAVARIYGLSNELQGFEPSSGDEGWAGREALESLALLIGPMMPHLAEELWRRLGHESLLADQPWPEADASLLTEDSVTIAVQVNGKLRATIELPRDCDKTEAENKALAAEGVQRILEGKAPRKVIVVPNRVVNIVA